MDFETTSPQVVSTMLTIASFPNGEASMQFNGQTYDITVKIVPKPKKETE